MNRRNLLKGIAAAAFAAAAPVAINSKKLWMSEIELPIQAQALEVIVSTRL